MLQIIKNNPLGTDASSLNGGNDKPSVAKGVFFMTKETWRNAYNSNGTYAISSIGRMKRLEHSVLDKRGVVQLFKERLLKPCKTNHGYFSYTISVNGNVFRMLAHRFVAIAFIPNPDNKPHINHIDSNRQNNKVENLEWCTHSENMKHSFLSGNSSQLGDKNSCSKLTTKQVINIFFSTGSSYNVAKKYPITAKTVRDIRGRKSWTHITNGLLTKKNKI